MTATITEAEEFGESVRHHRETHGWNRPEMVLRLRQVDPDHGWTTQKLVNVERGAVRHPPIRLIRILSIVLGCEVDELVWPRRTGWYGDPPADLRVLPHQVEAQDTLVRAA